MLPLSNQQSNTSGTRLSTVPGTDTDGMVKPSKLQQHTNNRAKCCGGKCAEVTTKITAADVS